MGLVVAARARPASRPVKRQAMTRSVCLKRGVATRSDQLPAIESDCPSIDGSSPREIVEHSSSANREATARRRRISDNEGRVCSSSIPYGQDRISERSVINGSGGVDSLSPTPPTLGLARRPWPAVPFASQPERRLGRRSTGAVADGGARSSHRPLPAPPVHSLLAPLIGVQGIDPDAVNERPIGWHRRVTGKFD